MEWDINNLENIVNYINLELSKGKTMVSIEQDIFKVNERVLHKRLNRLGYKKIDNQYQIQDIVTSNITPSKKQLKPKENNDIISIKDIKDIDKLNLLLDNLDKILKLIPSNITSNTSLRSGSNDVKSFRIDTGIYKAIKERANRDNINIADIINKALEDYLNNYI